MSFQQARNSGLFSRQRVSVRAKASPVSFLPKSVYRKLSRTSYRILPSLFALGVIACTELPANAQFTDYTWLGSDSNWSTAGNWFASLPVSSATSRLYFGFGQKASTNNLANPLILNKLTFGTADYAISGNTLDFRTGAGVAPVIDHLISGSNTISAPITLTNDLTTNIVSGGTLTLSGAISGAGGLTKTGAGTLIVSANPTFTGAVNVTGGTLQFAASGTSPSWTAATNLSAGSNFAVNFDTGLNSLVLSGVISGAGNLVKTGNRNVALTAANTFSGQTTISGSGKLFISNALALQNSRITMAADNLIGFSTAVTAPIIGSLTGSTNLALTASSTAITLSLGNDNTDFTYGGEFAGLGGFTKVGTGTLTLTANHLFADNATVNAGTLVLANTATIGTAAGTVVNGGTLTFASGITTQTIKNLSGTGGTVDTTNRGNAAVALTVNQTTAGTFAGSITGSGSLTKTGSANLILTGSNTFTGLLTVSSGLVVVGNSTTTGSIACNVDVASGAIIAFSRSNDYTYSGTVSGGGGLNKNGVGTLFLNGNLTYTGATTVNNGILELADGLTSNSFNRNFTVNVGAVRFNRSDNITYSGIISGAGNLRKAGNGTLTLTGDNSFTGTLFLGAGTVTVGNVGALDNASQTNISAGTLNFASGITAATIGALVGTAGTVNLTNLGNSAVALTVNQGIDSSTSTVITGTGSLIKAGTGTLSLTSTNTYTGVTTINAGTLSIGGGGTTGSITSDVTVASGANLAFNRTDAMTFSRNIGGAGNLVKNGSNTLTLTGNLSYTGTTTINAGTLEIGGALSAVSFGRDIFVNGGTLLFNRSDNITYGNVISGTGTVNKSNTGTLTLTGDSSFTGALTVSSGTLTVGNVGAIDNTVSVTLTGGTLNFGNGITTNTINTLSGTGGTINLTNLGNSAVTLTVNQTADGAFSGTLNGSGNLTKTGTGTLTLTSTNTFNGTTTVSGGAIALGNGLALQNSTVSLGVANGVTFGSLTSATFGGLAGSSGLALSNASNAAVTLTTGANNSSYGGILSGSGNLVKAGTGTLTLTGDSSFTGALTVSSGTLTVGNAGAIDNAVSVTLTGGTLNFGSGITTNTINTLSGTGGTINLTNLGNSAVTLTVNQASNQTYAGTITGPGSLIKTGTGTLILTGTNTFIGATSVNSGRLAISSDNNLGTAPGSATANALTLDGGTLQFNSSMTVNANRGITLGSNGGTIDTNGNAVTYGGIIAGTGTVNKSGTGTLTLTGDSSFTGALTVSSGTLTVGNAGAIDNTVSVTLTGGTLNFGNGITTNTINTLSGTGGTINLTNLGNSAVALTVNQTADGAFSGTLNGSGNLTKTGSGTLILTGTNTFTGATSVNSGRLAISADSGLGSAPGSATANALTLNGGTLQFNSSMTLNANRGMTLGSNGGTIDTNGNNATYGGILAGSGTLAKTGAGILTLNGANTFSGTTNVNGGTVALGNSLALQNSTVSLGVANGVTFGSLTSATFGGLTGASGLALSNASNAAVALTVGGNNASTTYSAVLSGSGSLIKTGTGTLTLTGTNTFTGATSVNSGRLAIAADNGLGTAPGSPVAGALILNGGTLQFNSSMTLNANRGMTLGSNGGTIDTNGNNATYGGILAGSGTLAKTGAGILTLNGANTFSGTTNVNGGTVALGNSLALQNSTVSLNVANAINPGTFKAMTFGGLSGAAALSLTNASNAGITLTVGGNNNSTTYSGPLTGNGGLIKTGSGTLTLTGANTFTGNSTVTQGTLVQEGGTFAAGITVSSGAALHLQNGASLSIGAKNLRANTGGNIVYDNVSIEGGFLSGGGTHTIATGGLALAGTTIQNTKIIQNGDLSLTNVSLRANLTSNTTLSMEGVVVGSSGVLAIGGAATANDLEVDGQLSINRGGRLDNGGDVPVFLGGGSRTNIGVKDDITSNVSDKAVLDLGGNTLEVNGGLLVNNGIIQNGLVNINYGGTAKGAGDYAGGYALNDGGSIIFGNSPGLLNSGSAVWNGGANLTFQIDDALGAGGVNWGVNNVLGTLALNAGTSAASRLTLTLQSFLLGTTEAGALSGFDYQKSYSWEWVRTTGGIQGFDENAFTLDTTGFVASNALKGGKFSVVNRENSLWVRFNAFSVAPESDALWLMLPGLSCLFALRRRSR